MQQDNSNINVGQSQGPLNSASSLNCFNLLQ